MSSIVRRRLRRKIAQQDLLQRYETVLQDPSDMNIDRCITGYDVTGIELQPGDYNIARYLLAITHASMVHHPADVFADTLILHVSGNTDQYRLRLAKLEKLVLKYTDNTDTSVLGPDTAKPAQAPRVFGPRHRDEHDIAFGNRGRNGYDFI